MKFKNFIEHISLHFEEDPEYFRDEKKKIAFVLLYMKEGTAMLVDKLYVSGLPPSRYEEWRKLLLNYNQIWREREKEKKGYFGLTEKAGTRKDDRGGKKAYSGTKDRTGTVYSGARQPMEIDEARYRKEGLCFTCRVKGHIGKFCKVDLRAMIAALSKEECEALKLDF
ncbi:hypothetical protein SERLA73DRAFT_153179 [Serpula lacrymans var. lacrymans S7.3]|uniref:CCHC-type domain-containing protein n=1 Tax=Serpula lacrymans var. lacrymans (strain S7.3) TaxID=936435 RepID=F8Q0V4_SERL3|nr:hypothetical protein SERLA73DRAFT_153179 [Serpula lacrymans var. lacrymans S7.3]